MDTTFFYYYIQSPTVTRALDLWILEENTSCFSNRVSRGRGALVSLNMTLSNILTCLITKYLFLSNLNPDCCHLGPNPFVQQVLVYNFNL